MGIAPLNTAQHQRETNLTRKMHTSMRKCATEDDAIKSSLRCISPLSILRKALIAIASVESVSNALSAAGHQDANSE